MRITLILIMGFLLTNCSNSYVKNKKIIKEWRSVRVKNHAQEVLNYILEK